MRPVCKYPPPAFPSALGLRPRTLAFSYHTYGAALLQSIGEYCSYCEAALCGNAAVEHLVAKASSPQLENSWDNFLLACVNCNSAKGIRVDRVSDLSNYLWPCDVTQPDIFQAYEYYWDSSNSQALVRARSGLATTERAIATLRLLGFDNASTGDGAAKNRRTENRTRTWVTAVRLADSLVPFCAPDGSVPAAIGALLVEQVIAVAQSMGFWSVWMTVFERRLRSAGVADDGVVSLLTRLFIDSFPGTYFGPAKANYTFPATYTGLPS